MKKRAIYIIILTLILGTNLLNAQSLNKKFNINLGISTMPLKIHRTNLYRLMVFPAVRANYRISKDVILSGTYLNFDLRLLSYTMEIWDKYSETPDLETYEEAVTYIGKRYGLSEFYDYIFIGLNKYLVEKNKFKLLSGMELGYRFGGTFKVVQIFESPGHPNGFEIITTFERSSSPGLNFFLDPKVFIGTNFSISLPLGSFIFINWPIIQPYIGIQLGFSL